MKCPNLSTFLGSNNTKFQAHGNRNNPRSAVPFKSLSRKDPRFKEIVKELEKRNRRKGEEEIVQEL